MASSITSAAEKLFDITPAPWWVDAAIIVAAFVMLYALSTYLRRKSRRRLARVLIESRSADAFASLSRRDFEEIVGDAFRVQGWGVRELHGSDVEDGISIELMRDGRVLVVECSHWRAPKVPVAAVRELYFAMENRGAAGAYLVTSGTFTEDARAFVQGTDIVLVDGPDLFDLVGRKPVRASA